LHVLYPAYDSGSSILLKRMCCGPAFLPPWGLVYVCAAAEPPGPPHTLYSLPQPLKGCRRKVRINMRVEVRKIKKDRCRYGIRLV